MTRTSFEDPTLHPSQSPTTLTLAETFIRLCLYHPLPSAPSHSTMLTHGGLPTHMIVNPELTFGQSRLDPRNLVALSTRSVQDPAEGNRPIPFTSNPEPRPKKKQRIHVKVSNSHHEVITAPRLVTGDGRHADNPHRTTLAPITLLRFGVARTHLAGRAAPPPDSSREPDHEPAIPMATINPGLRLQPWNGTADNELIGYKMDSRSRPSWKTIGLRLKRTPESCKARWLWLKNTRSDLNTRKENEAGD